MERTTIFKVIFVRHEIISCQPVTRTAEFKGDYYCEYEKDNPIFAIIKADTEEQAREKARAITQVAIQKGARTWQ